MECVKEIQKTLHNYTHARYLLLPHARRSKNVRKRNR